MTNPLTDLFGLPQFSAIKPEHIQPAIEKAIGACKTKINEVLSIGHYSWVDLVAPIEEIDDMLSRQWSPVSHMNSVVSNDALREAHDACLPALSEYSTWVGQNAELYSAYCKIEASNEFCDLSQAQQKVITQAIRDFKLSGVALDNEKKTRYAEVKSRLSDLGSTFSNNVMDATLGWQKHITDQSKLAGLPDSAKGAAKQLAESKELEGWLFTLDIPSYLPIMTHANSSELREEMYRAYTSRASDQGPNAGKWDNTEIINETLSLRQELAQLLGFKHFAEYSLASKMANSSEQVNGFLQDLAKRSKPQAQQDIDTLTAYAKEHFKTDKLQAWDFAYYSEKLKEQTYKISDEQLRPYFPENKVIKGLFEVVSRLYNLTFSARHDIDTWHKDVRFYDIHDQTGGLRGSFYLDLYAREKKRGGAWTKMEKLVTFQQIKFALQIQKEKKRHTIYRSIKDLIKIHVLIKDHVFG